jgi:hypothetical protein
MAIFEATDLRTSGTGRDSSKSFRTVSRYDSLAGSGAAACSLHTLPSLDSQFQPRGSISPMLQTITSTYRPAPDRNQGAIRRAGRLK